MSFLLESSDLSAADEGTLRLRSLVFIRWIAILGQVLSLTAVVIVLGFEVPLVPAAAVVLAAAAVNLASLVIHGPRRRLSNLQASCHLAFDLLQLSALLSLTGGLGNPFALLIMAPVVVSAAALPARHTVVLAALAIALVTAMAFIFLPLPWGPEPLALPVLYRTGIWIALVLAVVFTAAYVSALSRQARSLQQAYGAAQLALAREQRLAALGGLAAAAAHRLGSPLATIAVVARELEREALPEGALDRDALAADLRLLREESDRCREILRELQEDTGEEEASPMTVVPITAVIEEAAEPYGEEGKTLEIDLLSGSAAEQPYAWRTPDLVHGLGMLLQNAFQFARSAVVAEVSWDDEQVRLTLVDDGPGLEEAMLTSLGEPYFSTGSRGRSGGGHMGLGIFIARTFLARRGGEIAFANARVEDARGRRRVTGAAVAVTWPRRALQGEKGAP